MKQESTYDILGVGAPFLDHLLPISERQLAELSGPKYGRETVKYTDVLQIIEKCGGPQKLAPGGSCANTIRGLAALGRKCALTGKIGSDLEGEKLVGGLIKNGIEPLLTYSSTPTGHVVSLISHDGKRTCRTYVGASEEMKAEDLNPAHFKDVHLTHIEGYIIPNKALTERTMLLAKEAGAMVSLDLGSFEIVNQHKKTIIHLLEKYVDIVFSNKDETLALTGLPPEEACKQIKNLCNTAVVMIGKQGAWVGRGSEIHLYPALEVEAVDTTGAGDLFASGFLHAVLKGKTPEECARWGMITASTVVQVVGAEISAEKWIEITQLMSTPPN